MAASALEEKINKIRQQNEEIKRRHEEVEEDKKNAAKLNALVQMVPSTDWPDRKEPPEFSNPPRVINKSKPVKEHHDHPPQQYHSASGEGRKVHQFAQGQGPPPDPKYNFLADSEREGGNADSTKDNPPSRGQKHSRGTFRRKPGGKDGIQKKDYRTNRGGGSYRDEHQPEYEAWRAERNRIDEDRISRQRTAEGNWRREWDNDKAHIVNEATRSESKLGDYVKKDHKDFDRRYHANGNDYVHHNRGGGNHRSYRGNSRHFHNNYENRSNNACHQDGHAKNPLSPGSDERTVVATDRGIKVTLNQGNMTKGLVTSVKVNSPSIAGTGRVGPRQRSRITYSSHSDVEIASFETESFSRPKSFEEKTKGIYQDNLQKSPNTRKTQPPLRKKEPGSKSPYPRKKENRKEEEEECKDLSKIRTEQSESRKLVENNCNQPNEEAVETRDVNAREIICDVSTYDKAEAKDAEIKVNDEQSDDSMPIDQVHAEIESETPVDEVHAEIESETPVDEVHAEIESETSVDEVHAEIKNENRVDEVHAPIESETPVDEIHAEIESETPVDEVHAEIENKTPVDEVHAPIESETPVDEVHAEIESETPVDEVPAKIESKTPVDEVPAKIESEISIDDVNAKMQNETPVDVETEVVANAVAQDESTQPQIVEEAALFECEPAETDETILLQDTSDENGKEIKPVAKASCDVDADTQKTMKENTEQNLPTEQPEEIPCDDYNKQDKDASEQGNDVKRDTKDPPEGIEATKIISSSVDVNSAMEENKPASNDEVSKEKKSSVAENEKMNSDTANGVAIDDVESSKESPKKDLRAEEKKVTPGEISEIEKL